MIAQAHHAHHVPFSHLISLTFSFSA